MPQPVVQQPAQPAAQPATQTAKPAVQQPAAQPAKAAVQPQPAPQPAKPAAQQPAKPAARLTSDELITDLFEAMNDLYFARDADEGAEFVLNLAMEKFRSAAGMVQLYDINRREFVVIRAVGPNANLVVGGRTAERDPLIAEIMRRRRPMVLNVARDGRVRAGRWAALGCGPKLIIACAVELAGRFLGVLELANPQDGTYAPEDENGLAYVAERFAEFVAGRGLVFETETSARPK